MAELSVDVTMTLLNVGSVGERVYFSIPPEPPEAPWISVTIPSEYADLSVAGERTRNFRVQIDYYSKAPIKIESILGQIHEALSKKFGGEYDEPVRLLSGTDFETDTQLHRLMCHYAIPREIL